MYKIPTTTEKKLDQLNKLPLFHTKDTTICYYVINTDNSRICDCDRSTASRPYIM